MLLKYIFDRVCALLGLIVALPLLLIVALLIKLKMPDDPVFYTQKRVGKNGQLFTIYKFRTMKTGTDQSSVSVAGESRITPLGAQLRKYKIDELPELWNVLIGNMSFVGPRPDVPGYADRLTGDDKIILQLRPGITGPASLKYRNEEELLATVDNPQQYNDAVIYPDKVRLNKYYIEHYSFLTDIQIIVNTVIGRKMSYAGEMI